jgi:hypothetical protein
MPTAQKISPEEARQQAESAEAKARSARQRAKAAKEIAKLAKAEFKKARKAAKQAKKACRKAEGDSALAQRTFERVSRRNKAAKSSGVKPGTEDGRPAKKRRSAARTLTVPQQPGPQPSLPATSDPAAAALAAPQLHS